MNCFLVYGANLFSLSQIVELSHSDRRTVQFWTEAGALVPTHDTDRAGRGVHRSFDRDEAIIACILRAISQIQLSIGKLIGVARTFRKDILKLDETRQNVEHAIFDRNQVFLVLEPGMNVILLVDPTKDEVYDHLVATITEAESRHDSAKTIFYLNPWLNELRKLPT